MIEFASKRVVLLVFYIFSQLIYIFAGESGSLESIEEFRFDQMEFYPIGWSETGAFAYGTVHSDSKGHLVFNWFILDLIEDKQLFTSPDIYLLEGQSIRSLWDKNPQWQVRLIREGIIDQQKFNWGDKSFQAEGSHYSILSQITRPESVQSPRGKTGAMSITLVKDQLAKKQVYTYTFLPGQVVIDDILVKGYLQSPYEKRVAIVYLEGTKVEGDKFKWTYGVTGAHLTLGFSRVLIKKSDLLDAVYNGQNFLLNKMLKAGASVNERDSRGYSPLLIASRLSRWSTVEVLLQYDVDVTIKDNESHTALYYAQKENQTKIVALLKKKGATS